MPLSGHSLDSRYSYDRYHQVLKDRESYYLEFDVCIPIK